MQTLRQLVAGMDFSRAAGRALEFALGVASAGRAGLTVVHVCEIDVDDADERRLAQCDDALARVVAECRNQSVDVTGVLRIGRPWEKLDNVAVEVGASLIVVGRHGAGRGRSVDIGSVAERLMRCASRPVLTVPRDFDRLDLEDHEPNTKWRSS